MPPFPDHDIACLAETCQALLVFDAACVELSFNINDLTKVFNEINSLTLRKFTVAILFKKINDLTKLRKNKDAEIYYRIEICVCKDEFGFVYEGVFLRKCVIL